VFQQAERGPQRETQGQKGGEKKNGDQARAKPVHDDWFITTDL
jgi:hypothetical protein